MKKLYLAGPDVFYPDAVMRGHLLKVKCTYVGFEGLFPLDNEIADSDAIYSSNVGMMEQADAGLFNLEPFRGPSADVGTAFEMGWFAARKKPIFAYSPCHKQYAVRVADQQNGVFLNTKERLIVCSQGLLVEDLGHFDNLMIASALSAPLARSVEGALIHARNFFCGV